MKGDGEGVKGVKEESELCHKWMACQFNDGLRHTLFKSIICRFM